MLACAAGVSNRSCKHGRLQHAKRALQQRFFRQITTHPAWWRRGWPRRHPGSVAEAELLAPLAELLMPKTPIIELFRSFPSPKGWSGHYLEPDLAAYGVLKDKNAALFVEYDGYWRHAEKVGIEKDRLKNASLLTYAPTGSKVIRIRHTVTESESLDDRTFFICANTWRQGDQRALANSLKHVFAEAASWMQDSLQKDVLTRLHLEIDKEVIKVSIGAQRVVAAARIAGGQNTAEEMENFLACEGFSRQDIARMLKGPLSRGYSIEAQLQPKLQWLLKLGLSKAQVAKVVATFPRILGYSIEQNLKPTAQWLLDLGLSTAQVAKVVATFPQILGCSIEHNLKPTVQWLLDLGLSKTQVAKVVATFPQTLGYSIEQNLKPTVQWLLDLGLSNAQVAKVVITCPPLVGYSIEHNLKPTVQWLLDLGLSEPQLAKVVATFPAIVGYSIHENLTPKYELLMGAFGPDGAAQLVARWPPILGYSCKRLAERLSLLKERDETQKLVSAMSLTEATFQKRFHR